MHFTFIAFHATLLKSDVSIFTLIQESSVNTNEFKECKHFMLIYLIYSSVIKSSNSTQLRIKLIRHIILLCASHCSFIFTIVFAVYFMLYLRSYIWIIFLLVEVHFLNPIRWSPYV